MRGCAAAGTRRSRRLGRNNEAQVSFSLIAAALLLSTVAAGAYIAKREIDGMAAERRDRLVEKMADSVDAVVVEITLAGVARAQSVVSGWDSSPVNHSAVSARFSDSMLEYLGSGFPREQNGFDADVVNWTGGLFFSEMNTEDLISSDETSQKELVIDGLVAVVDDLPAGRDEIIGETTACPYYIAIGNFTVRISSGSTEFSRSASFERPVMSALPFIESKVRAFESASFGEMSDLGKLVEHMLTTLAQLRVLEGYGTPIYSGGLETFDILTELDVYRATLVGILLEQARLFRCVDQGFAEEVSAACGDSDLGLRSLVASDGRYVDPGELFLWFLGRTDHELDPTIVVFQAVTGLLDQLCIRLMEYMGWLGVLDRTDAAIEKIADSIDSVVEYLTGEDKAQKAVVSWIREAMRAIDAHPQVYAALFSPEPDLFVWVPERVYFVEDALGELHPVWVGNCSEPVDVPVYDILESPAWADLYQSFKEHQTTTRELIIDSIQRLAFDMAAQCTYEVEDMAIDPFDGVDLFSTLASRSGDVSLSSNSTAVREAVSELPMFSSYRSMTSDLSMFALNEHMRLFDDSLMEDALAGLAEEVLRDARHAYIPDLVVPISQQLEHIVLNDILSDPTWAVSDFVRKNIESQFRLYVMRMCDAVNASVARADDDFEGPMVDFVATILSFGAESFPPILQQVEDQLSRFAAATLAQRRIMGHKQSAYLDLSGTFEFWNGNASEAEAGSVLTESTTLDVLEGLEPMSVVAYDPTTGYDGLEGVLPIDEFLVQVQRPWDFDRGDPEYPNVHLTSLVNASATSYATQWTVSVKGELTVAVRSSDSELESLCSEAETNTQRAIGIDLCLPIVVHSASPLDGVDYNPSNTILSDAIAAARMFCDIVWDKLEPVVTWVKSGFDRVLWFLQDFFDVIASFATRLVTSLAKCLQTLVETMQEYIEEFASSVLGKAVKLFIDMVGTVEVQISLYGFTITIQTNLPDLLFKDCRDLLRIMVHSRHLGPGLTFGIRVAKLADGRYDLIANGTVTTDDFKAEVVVDPLMMVKRRLVELHVTAATWRLDLAIPEVETYETAEASTADLPGIGALLSNIPLPMFGAAASVEMGMRVKYSPPFPTNLVVNEFEANPAGDDSGREWVEVYNPLESAVDLDGWTVETTHGGTHSLPLSGQIAPRGYAVFVFPDTAIDNGQAWDPFNDGDSIALVNPSGAIVDLTPVLSDSANDDRTHQRNWDGGPKWYLRQGTMGDSNGVPTFLATADYIAKALFEAFREALEETKTAEVTASLEFLQLLGRRVLNHFIDNLLDIIKEVVHEVVFYLEATVSDATGVAGGGIRMSFVVKGEAISELLKWLIKSLATYIVNLGRAGNPVEYPPSPDAFFSNLHVRFEALFFVGMPRLLTALGGRVDQSLRVTAVVAISPNMPAIGRLAGRDWGSWAVDFGLCLEGIPREVIGSMFAQSSGELVDVWLVRAKAYGI